MTALLENQAEVIKLARRLGVQPQSLQYLKKIPSRDLKLLRESVTQHFRSNHRRMFQLVATVTRMLPGSLSINLAQNIFGPKLSARIASELPDSAAVDMAMKLPVPFLADVALEIDPNQARELIVAMPVTRVVEIALELLRREEYVLMAGFVDHMTDEAQRACVQAIKDETVLIQIGFFMEAKLRISGILRMLPPERLKKMLKTAHANKKLWPQLEGLMEYLDPPMLHLVSDLLRQYGYRKWLTQSRQALKKFA